MSDFTQITVTEKYTRAPGVPSTGYVSFQLNADLDNDTTWNAYTEAVYQVALDATGSISAALIAVDDPTTTPTGAVWTVTEFIDGVKRPPWSFSLSHTQAPMVVLKSLAPVTPLTLQYPYIREPAGPVNGYGLVVDTTQQPLGYSWQPLGNGLGGILIADNGDGTLSLTPNSPVTIVNNGDGTLTITD